MPTVHSHYENLKVARDASPEAIRNAYRALTRQHHPDRHPDDAEAARIMSVVNVAYGVLSDPAKRIDHDHWIEQVEVTPAASRTARSFGTRTTSHRPMRHIEPDSAPDEPPSIWPTRLERRFRRFASLLRRHPVGYGLAATVVLGLAGAGLSSLNAPTLGARLTTARSSAPFANATPTVAGYVRSANAPNGRPWPDRSGSVDGYPQMSTDGLSDLTIDNSRNDADMFAKLVALDGPTTFAVRSVYVAAHARLLLPALASGTYDVRYRNLASGALLRSPALIVEEVRTTAGTQHTSLTVRLFDAAEHNLQTYALTDADF